MIHHISGEQILEKYEGEGGQVVIPEGITKIGRSAFAGCMSLVEVTFPKTLKPFLRAMDVFRVTLSL